MGSMARTTYCIFVLLFVASIKVKGRSLRYNSLKLVSDGIDNIHVNQSSYLLLKGLDTSEECEQMYGFLPCSNNIFGHLFLIAVYEYIMFNGECYVANGGEQIFKILGPGVFGASAFHVLGALPESLIVLASGLLTSKETAQEDVYTSVGLVAGSTILLLTVLLGTCVIVGCQDFSNIGSETNLSDGSNSRKLSFKRLLSSMTGSGIVTDLETSYTARIMIFSVIPFLIVQIPKVFPSSSGQHVAILIALIVSVVLLLLYFIYQIFQPWIQKRRLEYLKHEQLILKVLAHVQKHALGKILTDDGAPNVNVIRSLFEEIDKDGDDTISALHLKELLEVEFTSTHINKDIAIAEVIKEFDLNRDGKVTKDEFVNAFTNWLDEAKNAMDKRYYSTKSLKDVYRVFHPWIQNKRKENEMKQYLLSEIVKHVQTNAMGSLLKEDGTPDTTTIQRLFENTDHDGDNYISQAELEEIIVDIKFGKVPLNADEAVAKVIEELDTSGDRKISEEEFVNGIAKWLNTFKNQTPSSTESQDDNYQICWEETDKLVYDEKSNGVVDKSVWAWFKATTLLVIGITILSVLAEPLINSVQKFSEAASLPSFLVSFILVPLATNARIATSAITAAYRKKPRTTSLTVSEIYGGVFMNNILGFCVLLSLIYVRGLTWEFSAEVLVVVVICAIVGLVASFHSTFPIWTSVVAYILYPLSLLLLYVLNNVLNYV